MSNALPLPNPYVPGAHGAGLGDDPQMPERIQQNLDAIALAVGSLPVAGLGAGVVLELAAAGTNRKVAFGLIDTFAWNGGSSTTNVSVAHGLGTTPVSVVVSNGRYSEVGSDARAPWLTTVGNVGASTFDVKFRTADNNTIGAFTPSGVGAYWVAIG